MATLSVVAFQSVGTVPMGVPVVVDNVEIPGNGANKQNESATIPGEAGEFRYIRLCAEADCRVWYGDKPDAVLNSFPLGAFAAEYFWMMSGWKIGVLPA